MSDSPKVEEAVNKIDKAKVEEKLTIAVKKLLRLHADDCPTHKMYKSYDAEGIVIRTGKEDGDDAPVPYFVAHGHVNARDAKDVVGCFLWKNDQRERWAPGWAYTDVVESWKAETDELKSAIGMTDPADDENGTFYTVQVFCESTKPILGGLVSPRFFVGARVAWKVSEGKYGVCQTSVDDYASSTHFDKRGAGTARGTMYLSGSIVSEAEESKNYLSDVRTVVQTSPGGSVPNWVATKGISGELYSIFTNPNKLWPTREAFEADCARRAAAAAEKKEEPSA